MLSALRAAASLALLTTVAAGLTGCGTTPGRPMMSGPLGNPTRCASPELPGTTVHVVLGDMRMGSMMGAMPGHRRMMLRALPATVPAGRISFDVANLGWRTHEMVVLPLAAGQQAGSRAADRAGKIDESGSLGEASATCAAGEGDGIHSGAEGWVTLTLAPGRYELVCNRPRHYAAGMYEAFTVS